MPKGGHSLPISTLGDSLLWKKAQKNLKKKKISETINNAIPQRKPSSVIDVCSPWIAPSREISRHHWVIIKINNTSPRKNKDMEFRWNQETIPVVKKRPPNEPNKGQGDSSTI